MLIIAQVLMEYTKSNNILFSEIQIGKILEKKSLLLFQMSRMMMIALVLINLKRRLHFILQKILLIQRKKKIKNEKKLTFPVIHTKKKSKNRSQNQWLLLKVYQAIRKKNKDLFKSQDHPPKLKNLWLLVRMLKMMAHFISMSLNLEFLKDK